MWGRDDLKQTRAYQQAEQEGRRTERQEMFKSQCHCFWRKK